MPTLNPDSWQTGKQVNIFQALGFSTPTGLKYPGLQAGTAAEIVAGGSAAPTPAPATTQTPPPAASGSCTQAQTQANQALGQQLAAVYGWGTGSQWAALNSIVMAESGWCNTIKNPSSTAYGIGQFLDSTWALVGGEQTSNATTQIKLMLQYIKQSYGTPSAAWAFHQANGYY